jgi:hypothetical protein
MALPGQKLFVVIITTFLLETTMTLSSDVNNDTPIHRQRRAMVFPTGTVLQVSLNMFSSVFYWLLN